MFGLKTVKTALTIGLGTVMMALAGPASADNFEPNLCQIPAM
jgi:hypothetical protein